MKLVIFILAVCAVVAGVVIYVLDIIANDEGDSDSWPDGYGTRW